MTGSSLAADLGTQLAQVVHAGRAASATAEPADVVRTPPPELVTPGTIGFLVTFFVAVALVVLVRDMVRRNRGLVVRAERRDAELREAGLREAEVPDAGLPGGRPSDGGPRDGGPRDGGDPDGGRGGPDRA